MDTELFMECEEEELEPWQQVDDSVEEDEMDFMDSYCEPVEDSPSPLPASETPPPETPPPVAPVSTASSPLQFISSSVMSCPPPCITSTSSTLSLPTTSKPAATAPPLMAQAPPLILTQTAGGTFLLPAAPGTGSAQPILLTTQGFQVPTMMNPGAPLVLNLQPGQTVQPLTLFQSSHLGQLVRPGVGMSQILSQGQTRTGLSPSGGPVPSGSAFTTMHLPTTLTIRTSTPGPVNLHVTKVSGSNSLKVAASPGPPSASANGVTKATPLRGSAATGHARSVVTARRVVTAPASNVTRVVMSVEEFYYGKFGGDVSLRRPQAGIKVFSFVCAICSYRAENNLRLMQHMLQHSELVVEGGSRQCCGFCYRQFSSSAQLKDHQEQVHGSSLSSCLCRICEWAFENEPTFLNHMKSNHKPGEMPYVCQVCSYRSSFYSDVLQHFATFHRDSYFLLCIFCLKVTQNHVSYQQHLLRHKVNQGFHCNRCRLQFVFLKDKLQHKLENHRSFRRPAQLEGLPPGSKVTIRTYGKVRRPVASSSIIQPNRIKTEQKSPTPCRPPRSPTKKVLTRKDHVSSSSSGGGDRLVCLECGTNASDLSAHYPTYVHCLLCPYSSCCSRAYAAHMIQHHVRSSKENVLALLRLRPPCAFGLRCSRCDFQPRSADQMADHLLMNPTHDGAICCKRDYFEPDIQFCLNEEQRSSEEPQQKQDLPWRSADSWTSPDPSASSFILPFTQPCGPQHNLSRNCDAIDFFSLLFPSELVQLIAKETNAHAKTCRVLGACPPDWVPVTAQEIKGFIGLVVLMGIHNLPDLSHYWSWSHYDNSYTFYRAMSVKRFKLIAANIRMGSLVTQELCGSSSTGDPLGVFRPMLDILGGAMWSAYRPNCCLTVDRALLPSLEEEGSDAKSNPKTQLQVWLLCDSKSGYCHRFFIQVGEKADQDQDLGFTVVPELMKGLDHKNHQLFLANSLTSIPLMQKLLDQGIYASSSFPPPNPILPRELWDEGRLEKPGDFLQRQFGPLLATRWKDTKEMGCLSTNAASGEPDTVWRRSPTKAGGLVPMNRPMAFRLLQENMRGVDICKQLLACNPLGGVPQDRHWRNLFWFLINLSVVNAFIVLRESRKDSPPAWVQDGLFSQVNFRKRLGNQLAKCAQKYFETMEMASPRAAKSEPSDEPLKQRHKMSKISNVSKRCKNCNLKDLRHESVYGCIICKANLCKQPSCFWEFHGLSPLNKGSTKVGFLKDRLSGAVEVEEVPENVDGAMAPVEDSDFSDDEKLGDLEDDEENEPIKDDLLPDIQSPPPQLPSAADEQVQPSAQLCASKEREDFLSARQLRITLFALCEGLRQTLRIFSTDWQVIRSWLKEARKGLKQTELEHKVHAAGTERMVAWVLSMREQQLPITESSLFHKASLLKKKGAFSDGFRISYDWAVSFLLQHQLGVRSVGRAAALTCALPPSLEDKVQSFRGFTQRVFRVHQLTESSVAAVDELSVFVDLSSAQDKLCRSEALKLSGSTPLITVYLTALADGTMLPSLVLTTRKLLEKVLPDFILLQASPGGLPVEEALDLWTKKVWLHHVSSAAGSRRSMLVLDRHQEHLGDRFLSSLSGLRSLPAVIPGGCSVRLQPLEVCMKPVLQRFFLSRWSEFTARNPPELQEATPDQLQTHLTQLLVDWTVEALTRLNRLPQFWKKSFDLTDILPTSRGVSQETGGDKKQKLDLLKDLNEILLGAETTEADSPELQDLEDEDETEKTQVQREEQAEDQRMEGEELMEREKDGEEDIKEERRQDRENDGVKPAKDMEDRGEEEEAENETGEEESKTTEVDSEEEGKETEEDTKDTSKERRETRIVIGEEVGDEWKITMKSRTEGAEVDEEETDRMDES